MLSINEANRINLVLMSCLKPRNHAIANQVIAKKLSRLSCTHNLFTVARELSRHDTGASLTVLLVIAGS
jgi:hypothetical protein